VIHEHGFHQGRGKLILHDKVKPLQFVQTCQEGNYWLPVLFRVMCVAISGASFVWNEAWFSK
jgi:hypothetical protein